MAYTIDELLGLLRVAVPFAQAAGWDVVGLQVGDGNARAERVAITHEVSDAVLDELERERVDLLVAYHPLMLRKVNRIVAGVDGAGRAYRLIGMDTSLAVVHTAFDVARGGTSDALAVALGLSDTSGFGPLWPAEAVKVATFTPKADANRIVNAMATAGSGDVATYSVCSFRSEGIETLVVSESATPVVGRPGSLDREPEVRVEMLAPRSRVDEVIAALVAAHRYEDPAFDVVDVRSNAGFVGRLGMLEIPVTLREFARRVGRQLDTPVRVAGDPKQVVATVAVVPGSGSPFIESVAGSADVFVTGDVTHHGAREALENGIAVIDPGHIPTERPGVQALVSVLSGVVSDVVDMTYIDANPWKEW